LVFLILTFSFSFSYDYYQYIHQIIAYLDPDTATKIQVCSGAGSVNSAVPEKVKKFIDEKSIEVMERRRKAFFVP